MEEMKSEAILLFVRDWGASDRIVTLFSREFGKIAAMAYGARRAKSSFGSLQAFAYMNVVLTPGKNIDRIKQCECIRSFRELREDLSYMAYSSFIAELVSELWPDRQSDIGVFELLLKAFSTISERNPRLVALACAWHLIELAGFRPELHNCIKCNITLEYPVVFDIEAGGTVCRACNNSSEIVFREKDGKFLDFLLNLDWQMPGDYKVNGSTLVTVESLLIQFIHHNLDKQLKSIDFINQLGKINYNV